jgi:hypothetical protein
MAEIGQNSNYAKQVREAAEPILSPTLSNPRPTVQADQRSADLLAFQAVFSLEISQHGHNSKATGQ